MHECINIYIYIYIYKEPGAAPKPQTPRRSAARAPRLGDPGARPASELGLAHPGPTSTSELRGALGADPEPRTDPRGGAGGSRKRFAREPPGGAGTREGRAPEARSVRSRPGRWPFASEGPLTSPSLHLSAMPDPSPPFHEHDWYAYTSLKGMISEKSVSNEHWQRAQSQEHREQRLLRRQADEARQGGPRSFCGFLGSKPPKDPCHPLRSPRIL